MNFTSPARQNFIKTPEEKPVRHPGGNIAYFFFFDDTDIPLRRLLLADSLKKVTLRPYHASAWDESGVFVMNEKEKGRLSGLFFMPEIFYIQDIFRKSKKNSDW